MKSDALNNKVNNQLLTTAMNGSRLNALDLLHKKLIYNSPQLTSINMNNVVKSENGLSVFETDILGGDIVYTY